MPHALSFFSSMRGKPRRGMLRRAVFSDMQRKGLEKMFQKQKYISKPDRKKLASKLGLKDSQVYEPPHEKTNNVLHMSRLMRKPTICICENKDTDQIISVTAKLISAFVFATQIVHFLFFLNVKFQASSSFLCLYRPVCVGSGRKQHLLVFSRDGSFMIQEVPRQYHFRWQEGNWGYEKQFACHDANVR